MRVEIINTGSELMLGRLLNSHQQWLCRRLADHGYPVDCQIAVPDTGTAIRDAVREVMERAELIIVTGGLGPTSDDLTRDFIAGLLGKKLVEDPAIVERIRDFFTARRRTMPLNAHVQAMVPEGGIVLHNANGTAPGLALDTPRGGLLILLPGPPRELYPMFDGQVVPLLQKRFPHVSQFVCRTIRTSGLGESFVEERISDLMKPFVDAGMDLGYCARNGEVDVRFVARGANAATTVAEAERVARETLRSLIYGVDDDLLETVVVREFTARGKSVAVAESCTGGFISNRITNVPGASAVFLGGLVTYSNDAKQTILGVRAETLAAHGAVSEAVAREMAEGAREKLRADFALSVTGIAGPAGGTPEKPVGTVWMALASASGTIAKHRVNAWDRETFKFVTSQQALELLRRAVMGVAD
jgi:nicotinamide-nucleotide amidase